MTSEIPTSMLLCMPWWLQEKVLLVRTKVYFYTGGDPAHANEFPGPQLLADFISYRSR
jgi:hypothetical protein